jgi:hypothetical protein
VRRPGGAPRLARLITAISLALLTFLFAAGSLGAETGAVPGEDVRVNDPDVDQTLACDIQSEVSLAGLGDRLVAGWNDSGQCQPAIERFLRARTRPVEEKLPPNEVLDPPPSFSLSGYGWSDDGGRTWDDGGELPWPTGWTITGDPVLAASPEPEPEGTFFYATRATDDQWRSIIAVSRSTDGGRTFSYPVDVTPPGRMAFMDKPWIAVDNTGSPDRGTVYVAWTEWGGAAQGDACQGLTTIVFTRSIDGGKTFAPPTQIGCSYPPPFGVQIAVGPDGQVYLSWTADVHLHFAELSPGGGEIVRDTRIGSFPSTPGHYLGNNIDRVLEGRRPAPAACVGVDILADVETAAGGLPSEVRLPQPMVLDGDIRVGTYTSLAVDTFGSPDDKNPAYNEHWGNIYLAVTARPTGIEHRYDEADVAFLRSEDGGSTWIPIPSGYYLTGMIDDGGTDTDQFFPNVVVNPDSTVMLSWLDRRRSGPGPPGQSGNWFIELFAALSHDGGATFSEPLPVSEAFPPAQTNPNTGGFSGCYMGEYNAAIAGEPGEFLLAWGDNRDVSTLTGLPDPNVYFDRLTYPTSPPCPPEPPPGGLSEARTSAAHGFSSSHQGRGRPFMASASLSCER